MERAWLAISFYKLFKTMFTISSWIVGLLRKWREKGKDIVVILINCKGSRLNRLKGRLKAAAFNFLTIDVS